MGHGWYGNIQYEIRLFLWLEKVQLDERSKIALFICSPTSSFFFPFSSYSSLVPFSMRTDGVTHFPNFRKLVVFVNVPPLVIRERSYPHNLSVFSNTIIFDRRRRGFHDLMILLVGAIHAVKTLVIYLGPCHQ